MYRFVALVWAAQDPGAIADVQRFRSRLSKHWADARAVLDEEGLTVFVPASHPRAWQTLVQPGRGVIFGRVFRTGREASDSTPSHEEWRRIGATQGQCLLEDWWGRYVALFRSVAGDGISILRDPSSGLPCYVARHRRVWVVFSDIALCKGLLSLSVNWQYVAAFLESGRGPAPQTGLAEVTEVQPGELMTLRQDGVQRRRIWNPLEAALGSPIEDTASAIRDVRSTLERCVHAWASLHPSIVHLLSGGLDSSVVLSCLARAPNRPRVVCLHLVSTFAEEEERRYARLAAESAGCELHELSVVTHGTDLSRWMPNLRADTKPISTIYEALAGTASVQIAERAGATAIMSGVAGDSLFFQPAAEFAAADFIARHGLRRELAGVAWSAARLTGSTVWSVLRHAFSKRPLHENFRAYLDGLPRERASRRIPPGLPVQLDGMSASVPFYSHFDHGAREPDRCSVLLSQPLMELCLRIPSYVWISGGCDRSIVREAFADRVPAAVRQRTAKGAADAFYGQLLEVNKTYIRDSLSGGILAGHGWSDPKWLEAQLSSRQLRGLEHHQVLHRQLCAEFWLRSWCGTRR